MAKIARKATQLTVSTADGTQLESIARSQSLPAALSRRAQMALLLADGETNSAVVRRFLGSRQTVTQAQAGCGKSQNAIAWRGIHSMDPAARLTGPPILNACRSPVVNGFRRSPAQWTAFRCNRPLLAGDQIKRTPASRSLAALATRWP